MPQIIAIESKDIYFVLEFSFKELKKICDAMDMSVIDYDGDKKEQVEAKDYYTKEFYPFIKEIVEKYENAESDNQ